MPEIENVNSVEVKQRTERKLSTVYNLPSVPLIIFEVSKIISNPQASAAELAKVINKDQGLVTKILSVANSPLYGIPRRVSTIDFAIVILGFNHIKNIVVALSMMEAFKKIGDLKFNQKKYWTHCIMTATLSKKIADDLGYRLSGEVFTAGLLHDLGIPIIYKYFPKDYKAILERAKKNNEKFIDLEREILGVTHSEIGKYLADKWNLPDRLSYSVLHHHSPGEAEEVQTLCSIVHLADYATSKLQIADIQWDETSELDDAVINILNLGDREYVENLVDGYRDLLLTQVESLTI